MEYTIVENFLPKTEQDRIEQIILGQSLPWGYYANTNHPSIETQPGDTPQFVHGFMRDGAVLSQNADIPETIMQCFGVPPLQIIRAKANLVPWEKEPNLNPPHVDDLAPHMVFIYYVNDADGPTCLLENNDVVAKITPKKGRGVWFDGSTLHAASSPIETRFRSVVNFNIRKPIDLAPIIRRWGVSD